VLIDSRHGIKTADFETLDMLDETAVSYQLVLTKMDKIHAREAQGVLAETEKAVAKRPAAHPRVHLTSSEKGDGIAGLRAELALFVPH
jgi:GTP-binding protein